MRRALRAALAAGAFAVILAAVAAAPASGATAVKRFNPWSEDGNPLFKRYIHGDAECGRASAVSPRDDAWRCVSGTVTLDPCFLSPTDEEVFCAASPWAKVGYLLGTLIEEDHGTSSAPAAWALQVRKRRCTYIPGPARRKGPTYRCTRRGFLFGKPKTRKKTWTIRAGTTRKRSAARRAPVRTAWQ